MGVQGKLDPKDFLETSLRRVQIGYLGQSEGQRSEAQRLLPLLPGITGAICQVPTPLHLSAVHPFLMHREKRGPRQVPLGLPPPEPAFWLVSISPSWSFNPPEIKPNLRHESQPHLSSSSQSEFGPLRLWLPPSLQPSSLCPP